MLEWIIGDMRYEPDERWADWVEWFEAAYQDVMGLTFNRLMWRNIVAMLQTNKFVEHHSHVNGYLTRSYAQMQSVGIRRQRDHGQRRPTIAWLIHEIAQHPDTASRSRFLQGLENPRDGRHLWLNFSPADDESVDARMAAADLSTHHG